MEPQTAEPFDVDALSQSFGKLTIPADELAMLRECGPLRRGDLLVDSAAEGRLERVLALLLLTTDANARVAGRTALHVAAANDHCRVIELLLLGHAQLDALDDSLMTPLHVAAEHGARETVELLIGRGAMLQARDSRSRTPLTLAVAGGHADIAMILQQASAFEDEAAAKRRDAAPRDDGAGRTPPDEATGAVPGSDVSDDEDDGPNDHAKAKAWGALGEALRAGDAADVDDLCQAFDDESPKERRQLLKQCLFGDASLAKDFEALAEALLLAIRVNAHGLVEDLIDWGAPPDGLNADDTTPLMEALQHDAGDIAHLLLSAGARIAQPRRSGPRELHYAARFDMKRLVRKLVKRGARIDERDERGRTALHIAAGLGHTATLHALLEAKALIDCRDASGSTPLGCAVQSDRLDVVMQLLSAGAGYDAEMLSQIATRPGLLPALYRSPTVDGRLTDRDLMLLLAQRAESQDGAVLPSHFTRRCRDMMQGRLPIGFVLHAFDTRWDSMPESGRRAQLHALALMLAREHPTPSGPLDDDERQRLHACLQAHDAWQALADAKRCIADLRSRPQDRTPLLHAVERDNLLLATCLLDLQAYPDVPTLQEGRTPLHLAIDRGQGRLVELLLARGASVRMVDVQGRNALDLAEQCDHVDIQLQLVACMPQD